MNIAIWIVQGLLALLFLAAGLMKATRPIDVLASQMPGIQALPVRLVRFIGLAEILGGIGLILPMLTGVQPWLTPVAALGVILLMLLAAIFNVSHRETPRIGVNVALGMLAAFVAYGRGLLVPA
jgi:putative oxidoreductase